MGAAANQRIELAVGECIAAIVGGSITLHDDGSADSLHDLDLLLPSGRTAAIEVTSVVGEDMLRAVSASSKLGHRVDRLTHLWDIDLDDFAQASRKRIHAELPSMLLEYEADGRAAVTSADDPRLERLGVRAATSHGPGSGFVCTGVWGGPIGADDVVVPAAAAASKPDNLAKLATVGADEAHIAVWVDVTAVDAYAALDDFSPGALPTDPPAIPEQIDVLWLLRLRSSDGEIAFDVVWRWTRDSGWSNQSTAEMGF